MAGRQLGRGPATRLDVSLGARLGPRGRGASVAIPAISCGVYGYPLDAAATIAVGTVAEELARPGSIQLVTFVLRSEDAAVAFERVLLLRRDQIGEMAEGPGLR